MLEASKPLSERVRLAYFLHECVHMRSSISMIAEGNFYTFFAFAADQDQAQSVRCYPHIHR